LLGRLGLCQQDALQQIAAQLGKQLAMFRGLDALVMPPRSSRRFSDRARKLLSIFTTSQARCWRYSKLA
jgi:hypothetical protein